MALARVDVEVHGAVGVDVGAGEGELVEEVGGEAGGELEVAAVDPGEEVVGESALGGAGEDVGGDAAAEGFAEVAEHGLALTGGVHDEVLDVPVLEEAGVAVWWGTFCQA